MPVTVTYDLKDADTNHRHYVRSILERFGFKRLGGSVFRYSGFANAGGDIVEDWLNHVGPAITCFRAYILYHNLKLTRFTLDAQSVAHMDFSDPAATFGSQPQSGPNLSLQTPTNDQSSDKAIRKALDACAGEFK